MYVRIICNGIKNFLNVLEVENNILTPMPFGPRNQIGLMSTQQKILVKQTQHLILLIIWVARF